MPISLPPRCVAFVSDDVFDLPLGGSRVDFSRFDGPTALVTSPFLFDVPTLHPTHALLHFDHGNVQLIHEGEQHINQVNGRLLDTGERVYLGDGDHVSMGRYRYMDGSCDFDTSFRVHLSPVLPAIAPRDHTYSTAALLPASTPSVLQYIGELQASVQRLSNDVTQARHQLHAALAAATAHTCAPSSPPRPYGALVMDLQERSARNDVVTSSHSSEDDMRSQSFPLPTSGPPPISPITGSAAHTLMASAENETRVPSDTASSTSVSASGLGASLQHRAASTGHHCILPRSTPDRTPSLPPASTSGPTSRLQPSSPSDSRSATPPLSPSITTTYSTASPPTSVPTSVLALSVQDGSTTSCDVRSSPECHISARCRRVARVRAAWVRTTEAASRTQLAAATGAVDRLRVAWINARQELLSAQDSNGVAAGVRSSSAFPAATPPSPSAPPNVSNDASRASLRAGRTFMERSTPISVSFHPTTAHSSALAATEALRFHGVSSGEPVSTLSYPLLLPAPVTFHAPQILPYLSPTSQLALSLVPCC